MCACTRPTFCIHLVRSEVYGLSASVACAIQRFNAAMILENIYQASKPMAASEPSYHAPSHDAVLLSSQPSIHRTYMRASRIHPTPNSTCGSAISDLDVIVGSSQSSVVEFVPTLPAEKVSVNVQAEANSAVRLMRTVSVCSENNSRSARSTFVVDNRRSVSVC